MPTITFEDEGDWVVITDEETGVTTQGETKQEALLMLADALAAHTDNDSETDLLALAMDVFVPDPELLALEAPDRDDWSAESPSQSRVERNRELALHLAKTHKRADFSKPQFAHRISSFIHGSSHGLKPSMLAEYGADNYWAVFEAIASGTRSLDGLVDAGITAAVAEAAVDELLRTGLIAESATGELYAANDVVTVEPYVVPDENVIDWEEHFDHQLVADLDDHELPETSDEGVFVERRGTGYGWYHDPVTYTGHPGDVLMTPDEAAEKASMPCPKCFPDSDEAESIDVTELPGGITRYTPADPDREE